MTNHGIEFTKKKMGWRETVYQISQKKVKKKMGVMTNHGIEFTKKKMGLRATVYQISYQKEKKKDGGYDEPWNRIYLKKRWV